VIGSRGDPAGGQPMRRRDFFTLLGATATWPYAARAQQLLMPVVGFLHAGSAEQNMERLAAYRRGLNDTGFVEGQNVLIDFRWANGDVDRLHDFALDLISRQVAVIATPGSTDAALAAKSATSTIPVVFAAGGDVVALGLVASLSRPGANVTGATSLNANIAGKRLEFIRQLAPQGARYFALVNPHAALSGSTYLGNLQHGAAALGLQVEILKASTDADLDAVFANLPRQLGSILLVSTDAFFFSRHEQIARLAARYRVAAMFDNREYAAAGGLMSYGADFYVVSQLAGGYTGRILKGEKPSDLPVAQSAKYEFVINMKTATALGLPVPPTLLALADEVIE
jgi:putative tryptophan/tyrosine transport system substrate-binding protein